MITQLSYSTETLTLSANDASIEAFFGAMANFRYSGTGTMADKTYDKVWDYIGFPDYLGTIQFEVYKPYSTSSNSYGIRILINGVEIESRSLFTGSSITHYIISDGSKIIAEAAHTSTYPNGFILYRAKYVETGATDCVAAFYTATSSSSDSYFFTKGHGGYVGGVYVTSGHWAAQPITFGSRDGVTQTHYIYDATTAYCIVGATDSATFYLGARLTQNLTRITVGGHEFVRFGPFQSYDTNPAGGLWFRVS